MEWTEALKASIDYMEEHLLEDVNADVVARQVHMSSYYFQKGFSIVTGYTIGDYIRNRRLYLAGMELLTKDVKVIDTALKYGYETPESFCKAFKRFHGITPAQIRQKQMYIKSFQPLVIKLSVEGGSMMDVRYEHMDAFKIVGKSRVFNTDNAYDEIPKFWDEFCKDYEQDSKDSGSMDYGVYGISVEMETEKDFNYFIAGNYIGNPSGDGFEVMEIPAYMWAKFRCIGPLPGAMQSVNTRIYKEWLPGNGKYQIAAGIMVEMYTMGNMKAADYVSEIWLPVKEK